MSQKAWLCLFLCAVFPATSFAGPPPVITAQPLDVVAVYGGTATFAVTASSGTALSYQWYRDGPLFFDELLSGETRSSLILNNVEDSDEGQYFVKVSNAGGTVTSRNASLTVVPNTPPVANNNSYSTLEDVPLIVPASGVLTNDTDVNGQTLAAVVVTNVTQGSLSLNANGSFYYTPPSNYFGSVSFVYRASDGYPVLLEQNNSGGDNKPVSTGGTASQSFRHGSEGGSSYMISKVVLYLSRRSGGSGNLNFSIGTGTNSGAIAGSSRSIPTSSVTNTSEGSSFQTYPIVYDAPIGPFTAGTTYYLKLDNQASERFYVEYPNNNTYANGTYYEDGVNQSKDMRFQVYETVVSNPATVTINVTPVNDAPVATMDWVGTQEDTPVIINVLTNDYDPDGTPLTITGTSTTNGTAAISGTNVVFTPGPNYNGWVAFTYTVSDGTNSATAYVAVSVLAVNDAPIPSNDTYSTLEEVPLNIAAPGVLANDTDVETNALYVWVRTNVTHGTLTLNTNGAFTYVPYTNYSGSDSFTYIAGDGQNWAATLATVTINVTPVNDAPVAVNDTTNVVEDTAVTIKVLANDLDVDGDALTAVLASNVTHGNLSLNPNGSYTYTPNSNYYGSDSFTYRAHDGVTTGNVATVTINLTPVNDPPIAVNDSTSVLEDGSVNVRVLDNDSDPEGALLTVTGASTTNGTTGITANGTRVLFAPSANFNGTAVFSYTVSDGTSFSTAYVTVTVSPVNDAPVANHDTYTTFKDMPLIIRAASILTNDLDVDGNALTAVLVSNVSHGALSLNPDSSFTYTPASNYVGNDSFNYSAYDGTATSAVATVTITVLDNTLSLGSAEMTAAGFRFQLSGPPASTYVVEASTNLTAWSPISTNSGLTGSVVFTDTEAANSSQRYYRGIAR